MEQINTSECLICKSQTKKISNFARSFTPTGLKKSVRFCWPIMHCSQCGLIRIKGDFEIFEEYHYALASYRNPNLEDRWRINRENYFRWLIQCIKKINIPNKSIIDFGCSYGHMLQLMKENGWRICGVEIDYRLLEILKQKFHDAVIINDLDLIPDTGSWGLCTMIDSLYYVEDLFKTLLKVKNALAPGGYIFIRITNRNWLIKLISYYKKNLNGPLISSALTHFSKKSIHYLLKQAGFTDITWIYKEKGRNYYDLKTLIAYNILPFISYLTNGHYNFAPGLVLYAK